MTLYDLDWVKSELGDPGTVNVTDAEITRIGATIESEVRRRTNRTFTAGDEDYPSAQLAANFMVISVIKRKFPDLSQSARGDWNTAIEILNDIVLNDTDETAEVTGEPLMVTGSYKTAPENPDAPYRFATRSRGSGATYRDIINGLR